MKIAVTHENGQIFQHFGHTEQFKVYTVENGKITDTTVVDTNGLSVELSGSVDKSSELRYASQSNAETVSIGCV